MAGETHEYTFQTSEWWWIVSALEHLVHDTHKLLRKTASDPKQYQFFFHTTSKGTTVTLTDRRTTVFRAQISEQDGVTRIIITEAPEFAGLWKDSYFPYLETLTAQAKRIRRAAIGATFREILDEYYARRSRGDQVKLRELAERWGVNYNSLRQAKIRYDEERRKSKNASDD